MATVPGTAYLDPSMMGLTQFMNTPSDQVASQLAPMFAAGPGINWQHVDSKGVLPSAQDILAANDPAAAKKPSFDQILAGMAGVVPEQKVPQIQVPQSAAPHGAQMAPAGAGNQILQALMNNIMSSAYQRQGFGAFQR